MKASKNRPQACISKQVNFQSVNPPKSKKNRVIHLQKANLLTKSVQDLPFRNQVLKKTLVSHSSHKSISKFQTTVGEQHRPNGEYYGGQTSIMSIKKHRSADASQRNLSGSRLEKKKRIRDSSLLKMIGNYRQLQNRHRLQLRQFSGDSSSREMHRLAKIQEAELRGVMEGIIQLEEKSWRK